MKNLAALLAGTVFGAGLVISGMTDPNKVLAFLTLGSAWDPALIFVMGSAVVIATIGFAVAGRRGAPFFDSAFHAPTNTLIDKRLLSGATVFGVGWGITGFCPGPALVGFFTLDARAGVFMLAFVAGVALYEWRQRLGEHSAAAADG